MARSGGLCVHCGSVAVNADHIVPLSQGGPDTVENQQALCAGCHKAKTHGLSVHD